MKKNNRVPEEYVNNVRSLLKDQLSVQLDFLHKRNTEVLSNVPLSCGLVPDLLVIENVQDGKQEKMAIQFSSSADVGINDLKCSGDQNCLQCYRDLYL